MRTRTCKHAHARNITPFGRRDQDTNGISSIARQYEPFMLSEQSSEI